MDVPDGVWEKTFTQSVVPEDVFPNTVEDAFSDHVWEKLGKEDAHRYNTREGIRKATLDSGHELYAKLFDGSDYTILDAFRDAEEIGVSIPQYLYDGDGYDDVIIMEGVGKSLNKCRKMDIRELKRPDGFLTEAAKLTLLGDKDTSQPNFVITPNNEFRFIDMDIIHGNNIPINLAVSLRAIFTALGLDYRLLKVVEERAKDLAHIISTKRQDIYHSTPPRVKDNIDHLNEAPHHDFNPLVTMPDEFEEDVWKPVTPTLIQERYTL